MTPLHHTTPSFVADYFSVTAFPRALTCFLLWSNSLLFHSSFFMYHVLICKWPWPLNKICKLAHDVILWFLPTSSWQPHGSRAKEKRRTGKRTNKSKGGGNRDDFQLTDCRGTFTVRGFHPFINTQAHWSYTHTHTHTAEITHSVPQSIRQTQY